MVKAACSILLAGNARRPARSAAARASRFITTNWCVCTVAFVLSHVTFNCKLEPSVSCKPLHESTTLGCCQRLVLEFVCSIFYFINRLGSKLVCPRT